jgi:hypothetical protein
MACTFSIPFSGTADAVLSKARSAVQAQNGTFSGDASGGSFQVSVFGNSISGSYTVSGQQLNMVITDKPFLIPCGTIENFLKGQLG